MLNIFFFLKTKPLLVLKEIYHSGNIFIFPKGRISKGPRSFHAILASELPTATWELQDKPFSGNAPYFTRGWAHNFYNDSSKALEGGVEERLARSWYVFEGSLQKFSFPRGGISQITNPSHQGVDPK